MVIRPEYFRKVGLWFCHKETFCGQISNNKDDGMHESTTGSASIVDGVTALYLGNSSRDDCPLCTNHSNSQPLLRSNGTFLVVPFEGGRRALVPTTRTFKQPSTEDLSE